MNDPPAALAAAYLRASYRVESLEGPFTLRIGEYCAALQRWHEQLGVDCSAFISAANPFSVPTDDKQNAAAHERLLKRLATAGLSAVPGMGLDPNGQWVPERSMLVAGIPVAEALRQEYLAIVDAGFMLQIDDPRLAMHYMLSPDETVGETRAWAQRRIEALNHALRDIAPERVRHHTCYGINMGPRTSDFELKHLADLIVTIRAGYYSFEMANPRHEHEWRVWETVKLPEGKVLMPGCVTQASVVVEHPELVAQRIVRLAGLVGRERVMASTDCGFASTLSATEPPEIEPEIVWAKLASLVEGARLASRTLWG